MKKIINTIVMISALAVILCGCQKSENKKISKQGFYFDTIIQITLYGTDDEQYINDCFDIADKYEKMLSNTIDDSDISRINRAAGEQAVCVSDETVSLIQKGIEYGMLSGGKFDITIGELSNLWNFPEIAENSKSDDNEADSSVLPSDDKIKEYLGHVDYNKIKIDGNNVMITDEKTQIDLGGIAKGYIADKMKEYLKSKKVTSGIINLGGNVLTIGSKSDGSDYTVGIQKPFDRSGASIATIKIDDKSVVTSGIYERYYKVDGKIYHHILDTQTGYPVENDLYSVTIISDSSCDGDALSTTCFALGKDKAEEFIKSMDGVEAIFVDNKMNVTCSDENMQIDILDE